MARVRIIVADAQELVADGIRYRLANEPGLTVEHHVTSGAALLEWLRSRTADIVLMDVSMHAMDGIDTTRALRKQYPALKVLAHSALVDIEYVNSMLIEGARGYLVKRAVHQPGRTRQRGQRLRTLRQAHRRRIPGIEPARTRHHPPGGTGTHQR